MNIVKPKISAVGTYLPTAVLTNADLEKMVNTNNEWIVTRTGIRERHVAAPEQATSDMAVMAAREALACRGLDASELDVIIVCTVTPDHLFPGTACLVQHQIGATKAWGFDLIAACSGFLYGVFTGANLVRSGLHQHVLVIGADTMTRIIDYQDRATCILFGDGAGAMLIEPCEPDEQELGFIDFAGRDRRLGRRIPPHARRRQPPSGQRGNCRPAAALCASGRPAGIQIRRSQNAGSLRDFAEAKRL